MNRIISKRVATIILVALFSLSITAAILQWQHVVNFLRPYERYVTPREYLLDQHLITPEDNLVSVETEITSIHGDMLEILQINNGRTWRLPSDEDLESHLSDRSRTSSCIKIYQCQDGKARVGHDNYIMIFKRAKPQQMSRDYAFDMAIMPWPDTFYDCVLLWKYEKKDPK